MTNTIQIKRSLATGSEPGYSLLNKTGEPIVNIADERFFISKWDWTFFELQNKENSIFIEWGAAATIYESVMDINWWSANQ